MGKLNRQQRLVLEIADYLSDWCSDPQSVYEPAESLKAIESYGVRFTDPCDELVSNAIRHFEYVVNPLNKDAMPELLVDGLGFTREECDRYWMRSAPMWFVFGSLR